MTTENQNKTQPGGDARNESDEIIRNAVTQETASGYYTAEWGEKFGVYADGRVHIGESVGMEIAEDERPIALIKCPGIGNIDSSFWVDGWTERNGEGEYVTEDGRTLTLEECIEDCFQNGEVRDEIEEIIQRLLNSYRMDVESDCVYGTVVE